MKIYRMLPKEINFLEKPDKIKIEEYEGEELTINNITIQYYKIGKRYVVIDKNIGLPIFQFKGSKKALNEKIKEIMPEYIKTITNNKEYIIRIYQTYQKKLNEYIERKNKNENSGFNPLEELAKRGSGFQNGKERIKKGIEKAKTKDEKTKLVKAEYGLGGFSSPRKENEYQLHSADWFNGKIRLSWYIPNQEDDEQGIFTFSQLTEEIEKLISQGAYI